MMNAGMLKEIIKNALTKTITVTEIDENTGQTRSSTRMVSPGDEFLSAIVNNLISHIQTYAEITGGVGSMVFLGSGGLGTGVGGGIPGPVAVSLTGVPISGAINTMMIVPGSIK